MKTYKTQIEGLHVTETGKPWNKSIKKELATTTNGKVRFNGKLYNLQKLINATKPKPKARKRTQKPKVRKLAPKKKAVFVAIAPPKKENIIKTISFYFEICENYNVKSPLTKYYLSKIIDLRGFKDKSNIIEFKLFLDVYSIAFMFGTSNRTEIFKKYGYNLKNGLNVINKYLNLLTNECLKDFENGILSIKDFAPKPQTKTQKIKALQELKTKNGFQLKIPLRKKSNKELLNEWKKYKETIKQPKNKLL